MPDIERIALLGVGLIGGSLGLCWQAERPEITIIGYDQIDVGRQALERGAVDEMTDVLSEAVGDADLVVLATPLAPMLRLMDEMAPHLKPGAVVTDVGSVKGAVAEQARDVLPDANPYAGGHPMAGAEHSGIAHADPYLFENATYVLCPPDDVSREAFFSEHSALVDLIHATGAQILPMDAHRHDRIAAAVSHLPQLLAVALTNLAGEQHEEDGAVLQLAAGGFRDMTRIAASPFAMWREILVANHGAVLDVLGRFASNLQRLRSRLGAEDLDALETAFDDARHTREQIPKDTKGFLHPLADLYVYAEDQPGELARITTTLHEAGLNIKDIELLNIREDTGGVFRVGFRADEDADAALAALEDADFEAHRLEEA